MSAAQTIEYNPESLEHRRALGDALVIALDKAGFATNPDAPGEVTYTRRGPFDHTLIKIYTTIPKDRRAVRACGKDAIRVCAVYLGDKPRGLVKERRVFRVGTVEAIVERTLERARDVWRALKARPRCGRCGAPTFVSRAGNDVCAAICWTANKQEART